MGSDRNFEGDRREPAAALRLGIRSGGGIPGAGRARGAACLARAEEEWLEWGGYLELEPAELALLGARGLRRVRGRLVVLHRLGHRLGSLRRAERGELREELEPAREWAEAAEALAVVLWLAPSRLAAGEAGDLGDRMRQLGLPREIPMYWDARGPSTGAGRVRDPLAPVSERPRGGRASTARDGDCWRIHGWHPERWVRRYSAEQLAGLALLAARERPRFLALAHSQRLAQAGEFVAALERAGVSLHGFSFPAPAF